MKGPMTTQTLRGLRNAGAMHWRGDRATGHFGSDPLDTNLSFNNFIVAFEGLMGRDGLPSTADMQKLHQLPAEGAAAAEPGAQRSTTRSTPPNNAAATSTSARGPRMASRFPFSAGLIPGETAFTCEGCHRLDPGAGLLRHRRRGKLRGHHADREDPASRNMYQKVGMFGAPTGELLRCARIPATWAIRSAASAS